MNADCGKHRMHLSRYLDGEVSPRERVAIEKHLAACADCRAALETLRRIETLSRLASGPSEETARGVSGSDHARDETFEELLADFRSRHDLSAVERLRAEEMIADARRETPGASRFLSAEEVAMAELEPEIRRGGVVAQVPAQPSLRARLATWFAPRAAWRWAAIAGPAAAAAVVAIVLIAREPRLPEMAMERALPVPTVHEGPTRAAEPAVTEEPKIAAEHREPPAEQPAAQRAPVPAAARSEKKPIAPVTLSTQSTAAAPVSGEPAPVAHDEQLAASPEQTAFAQVAKDKAAADELVGTAAAGSLSDESWSRIEGFVAASAQERPTAGPAGAAERAELLLAAERELELLTRDSSSRAIEGAKKGVLALDAAPAQTLRSSDLAIAGSSKSRAVRPLEPALAASIWMDLGDCWYLLYKTHARDADHAANESAAPADSAANGLWGSASPAERALDAYQKALAAQAQADRERAREDSLGATPPALTPEVLTRARARIAELMQRTEP